jgi:hypothetical protein
MLIGLDFDNTLAQYDSVFAIEAKKQGLEFILVRYYLLEHLH